MMKAAHARGADKIELFSNSPVWWMCTNHNPSGSAVGALWAAEHVTFIATSHTTLRHIYHAYIYVYIYR